MTNWDDCYQALLRYCVPPGEGVYTVSAGTQHVHALHQQMYKTDDKQAIRQAWQAQLQQAPDALAPFILGVCSDVGGGIQRGANWGPLFLRHKWYQQPAERLFDLGDIRVIPQLLLDEYHSKALLDKCRKALYPDETAELAVSPLSILDALTKTLWRTLPNMKLLSLGGDHSVAYPLVKNYIQTRQHDKMAIIHFDAHTDLLEDRLGVDVTFGSWVSHILPLMPDPSCYFQVGIRATSKPKEYWQERFGIQQFFADDIRRRGPKAVAIDIIQHCQAKSIKECYITFDIDVLDISQASATGTPEMNGLMVTQVLILLEEIARVIPVTSADIVEVAPFVCMSSHRIDEPQRTLGNARHIMATLVNAMREQNSTST